MHLIWKLDKPTNLTFGSHKIILLTDEEYQLLPTRDEITNIQDNMTRNDFIAAIQHLTDIIRNQKKKQTAWHYDNS